jgi:hypothetical protein
MDTTIVIAAGVAACLVASGFIGFGLQKALPENALKDGGRDMIFSMTGLITLLLALVLGLLIWTAFGVYNTQKNELQTLAARALEFNLELTQYGKEADKGRGVLRRDLVWAIEQFWGSDESRAAGYEQSYNNMGAISGALANLHPETDAQRALLAAANTHYATIGETRLLMSLQLIDAVSWPLLITVTAWSCLLFCGFGVLSRLNATTVVALVLGACSVASAIFLILDLSQPYTSPLRLSPEALEKIVVDIDQ